MTMLDFSKMNIVWLEDISGLGYVRAIHEFAYTRARKPAWRHAGRLVGYEVLGKSADSDLPGMFRRHLFWVADHDRCNEPYGVYRTGMPCEGVEVGALGRSLTTEIK